MSYLDVVTTQTTALADERVAVDILGRRMTASVALVEALGGGWTAGDLPTASDVAGTGDTGSPKTGESPTIAYEPTDQ